MAGLKKLSTRIINKHATAAVWNTKKNFIPLQAETIVYDPGYDSTDGITYDYPRHKIGDGTHNVTELPFVDQPKAVVTQLKKTANIVTSVTQPTYTSAQYVAPSMGQSYSNEVLTVTFDSGSYTPAQFTEGSSVTDQIGYVEDVAVDVQHDSIKESAE